MKVRPVYVELLDQYRIKCVIKGDPLKDIPPLNPKPPEFRSTGRYTQERKDALDLVYKESFLWLEERKLIHHLMIEQN